MTRATIQYVISYIEDLIDHEIPIVDATSRDDLPMPCIAVAIESSEAHSIAMAHVRRMELVVTLRMHSGDDDIAADINDEIESALCDPSAFRQFVTGSIACDHILYGGMTDSWDGTIYECAHAAELLIRPA